MESRRRWPPTSRRSSSTEAARRGFTVRWPRSTRPAQCLGRVPGARGRRLRRARRANSGPSASAPAPSAYLLHTRWSPGPCVSRRGNAGYSAGVGRAVRRSGLSAVSLAIVVRLAGLGQQAAPRLRRPQRDRRVGQPRRAHHRPAISRTTTATVRVWARRRAEMDTASHSRLVHRRARQDRDRHACCRPAPSIGTGSNLFGGGRFAPKHRAGVLVVGRRARRSSTSLDRFLATARIAMSAARARARRRRDAGGARALAPSAQRTVLASGWLEGGDRSHTLPRLRGFAPARARLSSERCSAVREDAMPELRKDPVVGRWVIISTERSRRPTSFSPAAPAARGRLLPVLPRQRGQDAARGLRRARPTAGAPNGHGWTGARGAEQVPGAPDRGHARPPRARGSTTR